MMETDGVASATPTDIDPENALDLSESEEEEELEDLIVDFAQQANSDVRPLIFRYPIDLISLSPIPGPRSPSRTSLFLSVPFSFPFIRS
jgi:DNA-directed RNA polymerase III subunit RPC4